jgi:hypothetical protein
MSKDESNGEKLTKTSSYAPFVPQRRRTNRGIPDDRRQEVSWLVVTKVPPAQGTSRKEGTRRHQNNHAISGSMARRIHR